jgi:hypothetical protein
MPLDKHLTPSSEHGSPSVGQGTSAELTTATFTLNGAVPEGTATK